MAMENSYWRKWCGGIEIIANLKDNTWGKEFMRPFVVAAENKYQKEITFRSLSKTIAFDQHSFADVMVSSKREAVEIAITGKAP